MNMETIVELLDRYVEFFMKSEQLKREIDLAIEREKLRVAELVVNHMAAIAENAHRKFTESGQKKSSPPKYWNPRTGETWTGKGRKPKWLEGQDLHDFLLPASPEE